MLKVLAGMRGKENKITGYGETPLAYFLQVVHPVELSELPDLGHVVRGDPGAHEGRALLHDVRDVEEVRRDDEVRHRGLAQLQGLRRLLIDEIQNLACNQ